MANHLCPPLVLNTPIVGVTMSQLLLDGTQLLLKFQQLPVQQKVLGWVRTRFRFVVALIYRASHIGKGIATEIVDQNLN